MVLWKTGWLEAWCQRVGYHMPVGHVSVQTWLDERSDLGGFNRNRVVEAFEAYAIELSNSG